MPSNTAYLLHVLGKTLFDSQHPVAELGGANPMWKAQKDVSILKRRYCELSRSNRSRRLLGTHLCGMNVAMLHIHAASDRDNRFLHVLRTQCRLHAHEDRAEDPVEDGSGFCNCRHCCLMSRVGQQNNVELGDGEEVD